jgi:hypothetical protein
MTMLEYFKLILQKVSFDVWLFSKELSKASKNLLSEELRLLKIWCVDTFGWKFCLTADPNFSL